MLLSSIAWRRTYVILNQSRIVSTQLRQSSYEKRIRRVYNDGIDLNQQSIEINPTEHIRRCSLYKDIDIWSFYKIMSPNVRTLGDALEEGVKISNDGPCIGYIEESNNSKSLKWLSYSTVTERSRIIGSYLLSKKNLTPMQSKVAILSSNRPEYLFVEQACYMYGFIVISLYTTYNCETIQNILQRTQAEILVLDNLERVRSIQRDLLDNDQIKEIIVLDDVDSDHKTKIRSFSNILQTMTEANLTERPQVKPDSIATLILTSGTTGDPKLAMVSHENLLATAKGHLLRLDQANVKDAVTKRHCSFLPMAHVYERFIILQGLLRGTEFVFCPSPEQLPMYLSMVNPSQVSVVPRVLNRVYDAIMSEVNKSKIKQFLVRQALREQPSFLSYFIFRKVKELFGGQAKAMITGAAPITPEVMHFFRIALDIPIMEGYGQTESSGAGTSTHPVDMSYGTIGSPVPTIEIKLIDVPGTNYQSKLNQGEVCLRGPSIFKGYYGDEAKTRETVDEDGWLHTGDVGEWVSNGALRIIDRTKHIFKLNQGKYIAPERLEDVYIRSRWVAQIFVDGISTEDSVVAIVIPDEEYVRKHFPTATVQNKFDDLCKDERLKAIILSDLHRLAKESNFKLYETIKNIHLHHELFSPSNGLLTVTLKTRRGNARDRFQTIIKSLYGIYPTTKNHS